MTFLAIIVAVLILQAWGTAQKVQLDDWFGSWQTRVGSWGLGPVLSLALLVLLPVILAAWILDLLGSLLFGLVWLAAAVLILLYSFGRGDFQAAMSRYRGYAYAGDFEAAYLAAREENPDAVEHGVPETAAQVHTMMQQTLLYEGLQRWFAVLLYFVLLGPAMALAYRLLQLCSDSFEPNLARRWLFVLDWLPTRLLAATFAVMGDFVGSGTALMASLRDTDTSAGVILHRVGTAALASKDFATQEEGSDFGPLAAAQNREFEALLSRSAVCWIVVLSLVVLVF